MRELALQQGGEENSQIVQNATLFPFLTGPLSKTNLGIISKHNI